MTAHPSNSTPPQDASRPAVFWASAQRQAAFEAWFVGLQRQVPLDRDSLEPASTDASFRRYLRAQGNGSSYVVMDAPPPHEDVRPFVQIAALLRDAGLHAPRVLAADVEHGFLLLDDLGRQPYLQALQSCAAAQAQTWMREAVESLVQMQHRVRTDALPVYDEALLRRELELFPEWCVQREFGQSWSAAQQQQWQALSRLLIDSALAQPTVFVHRDWMPRNLMVCDPNPGILDFQDAVRGPITYDIASLLRDAFISWDEELELDWAVRWWQSARRAGLPVADDFGECWRQIEWMGMQRHLKVAGIFCRLKHRDGKPAYSADLPRFFGYLTKVALRYRPLHGLLPLIEPLSGQVVGSGYTF